MSPPSAPAGAPQSSELPRETSWRRRLSRVLVGVGILAVGLTALTVGLGWVAFGKAPAGKRLERMQASPLWHDGTFENPRPLWNDPWGMLSTLLGRVEERRPNTPIDVVKDTAALLATPPGPLRVTWLGHSTVLIELDGLTILTDPVFGERTSPVSFAGPERWYAPPIALRDLPKIDVVVISHDHYDHLDTPTIQTLAKNDAIAWLAPLGVGAHLEYWGVNPARLREMEWEETVNIGDVTFVCAPARHASGRQLLDQNRTLWAGWALLGATRRAYFSGDTGFFPEFKDFGDKYGPFDVVMMESGAYNAAWPDWHIGPEQAVKAHRLLKGKRFLPIHWGLFDLANHGWTEPVERVLVEAAKTGEVVLTPRPGQPINIDDPNTTSAWWPSVSWKTAEESPIVSRGLQMPLESAKTGTLLAE